MRRPLLDDLLDQAREDYAIALEREIKAAVTERIGRMDWVEIDRRSAVVFSGPGVFDVWTDDRPVMRIERVGGVERLSSEDGVRLVPAQLRVSLLS